MSSLPVDLASQDDATLTALRNGCDAELNRRASLKNAPGLAIAACWQYRQSGGDPADIITAITEWVDSNGA